MRLATPDITPAQIVAVVQTLIALAVAFGADLTEAQQLALVATANVLSALLVGGDAAIRRGRANVAAAQAWEATTAPTTVQQVFTGSDDAAEPADG